MDIIKRLAHRYGQNMSDSQYLSLVSALEEMKHTIEDWSAEWIKRESPEPTANENEVDYREYMLNKAMEE